MIVIGWTAFASAATAQNLPVDAPANAGENQPIQRDSVSPSSPVTAPVALPTEGLEPARLVLALGGVVLLIFILSVLARRLFPGVVGPRATSAIKVISRCTITPKQHLLLIQVGKRLVVVGDNGAQLNPLCEITGEEEVAALLGQVREEASAGVKRFEHFFRRSRGNFEQTPEAEPEFDETHEMNDPALADTQRELTGLSQKVRDLANELGRA
jgi:flagellar biogenesis protein FliO